MSYAVKEKFSEKLNVENVISLRGVLSECADPELVRVEGEAWKRAVVRQYDNARR